MFRCSAHRLSQTRRAESLRCHSAHCFAGPIRSRGFSSSVAAAGFTPSLPIPVTSLVILSCSNPSAYTPSLKPHSAGPAHTSEGCCRCTFIRLSVPEPERPPSLASTVIPSGSCRACRLACPLSGIQKERCFRIALPDFLRVELWDEPHAPSSVHNRTASHAWSDDNEYIHIKICPSF